MGPFPMKVNAAGLSNVGLVRENNEDSFSIVDCSKGVSAETVSGLETDTIVLVVADGMGGARAGEIASKMAVNLFSENVIRSFRTKRIAKQKRIVNSIERAIQKANLSVYRKAMSSVDFTGMGTTLTAAVAHGPYIFFAQIGDSRAYLIRDSAIVQMTRDQSLVAELLSAGAITREAARFHPRRNEVLQALGRDPSVNTVFSWTELKPQDHLVLCSDGLWGKLDDEVIKATVRASEPPAACENLVKEALLRGGEDNITVIVASFDGADIARSSLSPDGLRYQPFVETGSWWFAWKRLFSR